MAKMVEVKTGSYIDPRNLEAGVGANQGHCYGWTGDGKRYFWTMDADTLIIERAMQFLYSETGRDLRALERVREAGVGVTVAELGEYVIAAEHAFDWFMRQNAHLVDKDDFVLGPSVRNVGGSVRFNHDRRGVWQRTG